jgi:TolB-like protein/AraC-like DNA-binding protein/Tfp pilus assembly protein PilF
MNKTRRLAAVMFTDIIGYTSMMQEDEKRAITIRSQHRKVFDQTHNQYQGKILQYFGDGTLSVFQSSVEAVECAIAIQLALNKGEIIPVRIGLHVGDIVFDGTDIYGDGVNIASRIENLGVGGTILLSERLNDDLINQQQISTQSLGQFEFKNIAQSIEVFAVNNAGIKVPKLSELQGKQKASNKSIAILPFVNMSSDPDNEYFSDGITEEIINALTKDKALKVIARTSSFAYKGKNIDIRTIGKQLNVATILEGSVRKIRNRVRINAQLINANDGIHLWSKNFDRELEDIFALQDEISLLISDQIRENFGHFEIKEPSKTQPTKNIEAYEVFLKGSYYLQRKDFDDTKKALSCFQEAIQLDPNYAEAYAYMGETYLHFAGFGLLSTAEAHAKARSAAKKAIQLNEEEARAHKVLAYIHFFYDWDWNAALQEYNKAIACGLPNQNEFITYYYIFIQKDYDRAIKITQEVLETDPLYIINHWQLGLSYYFAGRHEEALVAFDGALKLEPNYGEALRWRGVVLAYLNRFEEAIASINKALEVSNGEGPANYDLLVVKTLMGKKEEVLASIDQTAYLDPVDPAMLYTLLDMPDEAIEWLEKGYQERSVMMVTIKYFWIWDNIREDARFKAIYDKMNFREEERTTIALSSKTITKKEVINTSTSLMEKEDIDKYLQLLKQKMQEEQVYLDASVSLRSLGSTLDLHPNKLSWLLNEQLGKNFNEYINTYRLKAFKEKALMPQNDHLTLLGLAYESGFNSKTVFNAFFKKMEGTTPSRWVKAQRN